MSSTVSCHQLAGRIGRPGGSDWRCWPLRSHAVATARQELPISGGQPNSAGDNLVTIRRGLKAEDLSDVEELRNVFNLDAKQTHS